MRSATLPPQPRQSPPPTARSFLRHSSKLHKNLHSMNPLAKRRCQHELDSSPPLASKIRNRKHLDPRPARSLISILPVTVSAVRGLRHLAPLSWQSVLRCLTRSTCAVIAVGPSCPRNSRSPSFVVSVILRPSFACSVLRPHGHSRSPSSSSVLRLLGPSPSRPFEVSVVLVCPSLARSFALTAVRVLRRPASVLRICIHPMKSNGLFLL
jgi:hypothetical protein